jgi:hypothetical protein
VSERCADLSRAAGEPLAGTATTAERWLLVEVPGTWPRDVARGDGLPEGAREAVAEWQAKPSGRRRVLFLRRPGQRAPRLRAFVVRAEEAEAEVRRLTFADHSELAGADFDGLGERVETQLVLVCGHGSRDACCALGGTAVFGALEGRLGEEELWISSHHGGHRFAANVLVLPSGLHFGRVEPRAAPFLVARALAGRIELDSYRGRTCYEPDVQAAEHAVRSATGFDGVGELRLGHVRGRAVLFRGWDGSEHEAVVELGQGPVVPASCGEEPKAQHVLRARLRSSEVRA